MKRIRWFLLLGLTIVFATACAGPQVRTFGDFESRRESFAKDKKVAVDEEVFYYHDWKIEGEGDKKRAVMEGEPDLSSEYLELAGVLKQEVRKQLKAKGFVLVPQNTDGVLRLKIMGIQKNLYAGFINQMTGVVTEGRVGERLILYYDVMNLYNPFFPQEERVKNFLAPCLAEAIRREVVNRRE